MSQIFSDDKLELAKKMVVYDFKRNKFSAIFELLKNDIQKLIELGLPYKMILMHINNELNSNIKYDTFLKWINKHIKQKNQNSNNTLKKNTQKQKDEIKKEEVKKDNDNSKDKDEEIDEEDWKSIIFPQIEKACEGMKKANLRI